MARISALIHDVLVEIMYYLVVERSSISHLELSMLISLPISQPHLCACALTCRSWLVPAKTHLYRLTDFDMISREHMTARTLEEMVRIMKDNGLFMREMVWWDIPRKDCGFWWPNGDDQLARQRQERAPHHEDDAKIRAHIMEQFLDLSELHQITYSMYTNDRSVNMTPLLDLLDCFPRLGDRIHHLDLSFTDDKSTALEEEGEGDILKVLRNIPALRQLSLYGHLRRLYRFNFAQITQSKIQYQITSLELYEAAFEAPVDLCNFIANFSNLICLKMSRTKLITGQGHIPRDLVPPALRCLAIHYHIIRHEPKPSGSPLRCMLQWLSLHPMVLRLADIEFTFNEEEIPVWPEVNGPLFQEITGMKCHFFGNASVDLSRCEKLHELDIEVDSVSSSGGLLNTLRSINSHALHRLRITFASCQAETDFDTWQDMHAVIVGPKFASLADLSVKVTSTTYAGVTPSSNSSTQQALKRRFENVVDGLRSFRGFRCEFVCEIL